MAIFDINNNFSPLHLYSLYGVDALFLHYQKEIDETLNGQYFLRIIIDDIKLYKEINYDTYTKRINNSNSPFHVLFFNYTNMIIGIKNNGDVFNLTNYNKYRYYKLFLKNKTTK